MIITGVDVVDVPVAEATVFTSREGVAFPRVFTLQNLTGSAITFSIEASPAGAVWSPQTLSNGTTVMTLGIVGSGSDITVERIVILNICRIRASGGGDDRDLMIGLQRVYYDTTKIWGSTMF